MVTDIDSMFVSLENDPQHLPCLRTAFLEQLVADGQQLGKGNVNDSVEVFSIVATLEAVYSAYCQYAMKAGED